MVLSFTGSPAGIMAAAYVRMESGERSSWPNRDCHLRAVFQFRVRVGEVALENVLLRVMVHARCRS